MLTLCRSNLTLLFKETLFRRAKVIVNSIYFNHGITFKKQIQASVCFMQIYRCTKKQTTAANLLYHLDSVRAQYFIYLLKDVFMGFGQWGGVGMLQKLPFVSGQRFYGCQSILANSPFVCVINCIIRPLVKQLGLSSIVSINLKIHYRYSFLIIGFRPADKQYREKSIQ